MGTIGAGKTTAALNYLQEVHALGHGCLIFDRRGDYWPLATAVPGALFVPWGEDRLNPLEPPAGIPDEVWLQVAAARMTLDLGLFGPGQTYCNRVLRQLLEDARKRGVRPTLLDFRENLRNQKPKPRSSEEGYRDRLLGRIEALLVMAGEKMLAVQEGLPVCQAAAEEGRLVVVDARGDKLVADFFAALRTFSIYYRRLYSPDPFAHRPVVICLDEQRNLIRAKETLDGVPDLDILFTSARPLNMAFVIVEQMASQISRPLQLACHLRLGFNCAPPESLYVAQFLGLNPRQAEELPRLPVGQAVGRLAGDAVPYPFRLTIPKPEFLP